MAEEQKPNPETPAQPPAPIPGNSPEARNPDGSLKDPAALPPQKPEAEAKPELKAEEPKKEEPKKPTAGPPEKYEPFKAPEGYELNEDLVAKFAPIAKELGLSQDGAQKLVDLYGDAALVAAEAPYKAYETMRNGWRDTVVKDPTLGDGKSDLKPEVSAKINNVINAMPNAAALREALTLTGAGDHPEVIRAFLALAESYTEGAPVRGAGPSPGGQQAPGARRTGAQALYPNLPSAS